MSCSPSYGSERPACSVWGSAWLVRRFGTGESGRRRLSTPEGCGRTQSAAVSGALYPHLTLSSRPPFLFSPNHPGPYLPVLCSWPITHTTTSNYVLVCKVKVAIFLIAYQYGVLRNPYCEPRNVSSRGDPLAPRNFAAVTLFASLLAFPDPFFSSGSTTPT